jgi:UDP-N-acetylglucosamine 2-epimerase (non-hydrolysing)
MRTKRHVIVPVGTRPELIKMADIICHLRASGTLQTTVVFTGQHTDLMSSAASVLSVVPDVQLHQAAGRSLTDLMGNLVRDLGNEAANRQVDCVIVQGDTVSALAGAIVSELLGVSLIHIEAGVRSLARDDPFPEETIRRIISPIVELHFCFSEATRRNLLHEGVNPRNIIVSPHPLSDRVATLTVGHKKHGPPAMLATLHRRERRRERGAKFVTLLNNLKDSCPALSVKFVWHPSLALDAADLHGKITAAGASIISPLDPATFLRELATVAIVFTDSAGVAEEAQILRKPLVSFRTSTEIRVDDAPQAPVCVTEVVQVAEAFIIRALATSGAKSELPRAPAPISAGSIIAGEIIRFLGPPDVKMEPM